MSWEAMDTWIVIVGALCAVACALPGCFLLLRGMSMMGDAISHAVLPGLAGGFLLMAALQSSSSIASAMPETAAWLQSLNPRNPMVMLLGAVVVGVLTTVFTQWVASFGRVDRGAAMGIVFTTLFAIGLLLIVQAADHVDLDADCVLYGAIEYTPLDVAWSGSIVGMSLNVPRAAVVLGCVALLNAAVILLLFKEFRLSSFDPELATSLGLSSTVMHYLLMSMVAVTTVAAFEVVGSIIVIAMLIVPAATAYLLTRRLVVMLIIATFAAVAASVLGHVLALVAPPMIGFESMSTAGAMAVVSGLLFFVAWLFAPGSGVIARRFVKLDAANHFETVDATLEPSQQ